MRTLKEFVIVEAQQHFDIIVIKMIYSQRLQTVCIMWLANENVFKNIEKSKIALWENLASWISLKIKCHMCIKHIRYIVRHNSRLIITIIIHIIYSACFAEKCCKK